MKTVELQSKEYENYSPTWPLSNVTGAFSATNLRLLESIEFCKHAESTVKLLEVKSQSLALVRSEAIRTKRELTAKNETNAINLESLFQIRNELYSYKCVMKTDYIRTEERMKKKKLKYNIKITLYKNKWQATEGEYLKSSAAEDVPTCKKEIAFLYNESIRWSNLLGNTRKNYFDMFKERHTVITMKITEFVKEYQSYLRLLYVDEKIRQRRSTLQTLMSQWSIGDVHNEGNCKSVKLSKSEMYKENSGMQYEAERSFTVDLTAFDTITIPYHTLEIQNEEVSFSNAKDNIVKILHSETENCNKNMEKAKKYYISRIHHRDSQITLVNRTAQGNSETKSNGSEYSKSRNENSNVRTEFQCGLIKPGDRSGKNGELMSISSANKSLGKKRHSKEQSKLSGKKSLKSDIYTLKKRKYSLVEINMKKVGGENCEKTEGPLISSNISTNNMDKDSGEEKCNAEKIIASQNEDANEADLNLATAKARPTEIEPFEETGKAVDGNPFFLGCDNSNLSRTGLSSSIFELF